MQIICQSEGQIWCSPVLSGKSPFFLKHKHLLHHLNLSEKSDILIYPLHFISSINGCRKTASSMAGSVPTPVLKLRNSIETLVTGINLSYRNCFCYMNFSIPGAFCCDIMATLNKGTREFFTFCLCEIAVYHAKEINGGAEANAFWDPKKRESKRTVNSF